MTARGVVDRSAVADWGYRGSKGARRLLPSFKIMRSKKPFHSLHQQKLSFSMGFQSFAKQTNRLDTSWEVVSATIWWLGPEMTRRSDVFGPKIDRTGVAKRPATVGFRGNTFAECDFGPWDPLNYNLD